VCVKFPSDKFFCHVSVYKSFRNGDEEGKRLLKESSTDTSTEHVIFRVDGNFVQLCCRLSAAVVVERQHFVLSTMP
jgi:hypothetical protein